MRLVSRTSSNQVSVAQWTKPENQSAKNKATSVMRPRHKGPGAYAANSLATQTPVQAISAAFATIPIQQTRVELRSESRNSACIGARFGRLLRCAKNDLRLICVCA